MSITKNLGVTDRIVRIAAGLILLSITVRAFTDPGAPLAYLGLMGILPLIAGIVGYCAPYRWLGINTYKRKNRVHENVREVSDVR